MKYKLILSDNLPSHVGGRCSYPWYPVYGTCTVTIRPKYKNDIGLLNHELKHVEQYETRWYHSLLTRFSKAYVYKVELEAYTEQIKEYKYTELKQANWIVGALVNKYNLDVSYEQVGTDVLKIIKENRE